MPQAVTSSVLLHADDSSILYDHKDVVQIRNSSMTTSKTFVAGLLITN